jgi:hypothetical protein
MLKADKKCMLNAIEKDYFKINELYSMQSIPYIILNFSKHLQSINFYFFFKINVYFYF